MMHMAGEVKARVGELTEQRDLLSVVFGGLVEGVLVVERGGAIALANDAARPLLGEEVQRLPDRLAPLVARAQQGRAGRGGARARRAHRPRERAATRAAAA